MGPSGADRPCTFHIWHDYTLRNNVLQIPLICVYWRTCSIKIRTVRRNTFFNLCFVSSMSLVFHPHDTSEHTLGVVSSKGVVQCWSVHGNFTSFIRKFITVFHVAWDGDYIAIPLDYLPDEGQILFLVIPHCTANIWLFPVVPQIFQVPYSWSCELGV